MTLLELIKEVCRRSNILIPSIAVTSQDKQIQQMIGIANQLLEDLAITRKQWTSQVRTKSWTSIATPAQFADIKAECSGFIDIIKDTFYDSSSRLNIIGPMSDAQWRQAQSITYASAYWAYYINAGALYIYPTPAAGHALSFDYKSMNLVKDADTSEFKLYFTKDTDTCVLDDALLISGIKAMWREVKGLAFGADRDHFESLCRALQSVDGNKKEITMHGGATQEGFVRPGIIIPDSNWPL